MNARTETPPRHPWIAVFLALLAIVAALLSMSGHSPFWPPVDLGEQTQAEVAAAEASLAAETTFLRVMAVVLGIAAGGALIGGRLGRLAASVGAVIALAGAAWLVYFALVLDTSAWKFLTMLYLFPAAAVLAICGLVALRSLWRPSTRPGAL